MAAQVAWWVVVPPAEQNAPKVPADALIISTQVGSSFYSTLLNTDSGTITVNGKSYVRYMGPFSTEAEAKAAVPDTSSSIGDLVGLGIAGALIGAEGVSPSAALGDSQAIANAIDNNPISAIAKTLYSIAHALLDYRMWRSLGWLALGILLMLAGAAWWIGPSASRAGPGGIAARFA